MARCVQALYDYEQNNQDELSFKKGDTIFVQQENENGWWYGSCKGVYGLFPSNYVIPISKLQVNRKSLQNEIINHIIDGEIKQIKEISTILNDFLVNAESFSSNSLLNKIHNLRTLLTLGVNLHQDLATGLEDARENATFISEIFLSMADQIDDFGCNLANIYFHLVYELEKNQVQIDAKISKTEKSCTSSNARRYLKSIFERLCKYPFLLKEYERYLEDSLEERENLNLVIKKYILIVNRIELMKRFKEMDIAVLNLKVKNWTLPEELSSFGDPILTLKILFSDEPIDDKRTSHALKPCILSLFHSYLFIFDPYNEPNFISLLHEINLKRIENINGTILDNNQVNEILNGDEKVQPAKIQHSWNFQISFTDSKTNKLQNISVIASDVVSHQYLHSTLHQLVKSVEKPLRKTVDLSDKPDTKPNSYDRKSYTEGTLYSLPKNDPVLRNNNPRQETFNRHSCFPNNSGTIKSCNKKISKDFIIDYILTRNSFNVKQNTNGQIILDLGHFSIHEPLCFWPKEFQLDVFNERALENAKSPKTHDNVRKMEILRVNYPFTDNRIEILMNGKLERRLSVQSTNYSPIRSTLRDKSKDDAAIFSQSKTSLESKKDSQPLARENRRRRQGRQKSAIDTDEVLKSMAKFHKENQLFDDSDLLNIIEFYFTTPLKNKMHCLDLRNLQNLDVERDLQIPESDKMLPSDIFKASNSNKKNGNSSSQRTSQLIT